jgi:PKD repeat protein
MIKLTKIGICILALLSGQILNAQTIKSTKGTSSQKHTVVIQELQNRVDDSPSANVRVPNTNWKVPNWTLDESRIIYTEPAGSYKMPASNREVSPAPDTSFHALEDNGSSIPPDVNGTVGPNHLMVTLNTGVRIQDREGRNLFSTGLGTFWSVLPGNGGTFDPKVIYDPYYNRWIMVTPSGSNSNDSKLYLGVSLTSDPLGEWNMYWIDPDESNNTWFDYPSIGFNKKWITISGNMFGGDYYRTVFTFDKMAVYNGDETLEFNRFATTQGFTIVPSITYDTIVEDQYFVSTSSGNSNGNGYIQLFKMDGPTNDPVFEHKGAIGIPEPWENGAGDQGNFLPQLGSSELINSVDSRMENVIYRNGKLWAVHHIFLPANNPQRTAVQWWNLDTDGIILERGRVDDPTNQFSFAFATIAVNALEDVFIGYDVFSATQYASAGYSYKSHYDEPNSMREYYQFKDGLAPYYKTFGGGRNRWGDYSNTSVDPLNDTDFWTIQEFASTDNKWGTYWAYLRPSFQPEVDFTANNLLIPVGETVDFTDLSAGVPSNWEWTFSGANPETSNIQNPNGILYENDGNFDVKLISSNIYGNDTLTKENFISTSSTILPEVDFSASKTVVCTDETVIFTDKTKYSPIQWEWQFDPATVTFINGTDANSQNPEVIFDAAGAYSTSLKVWNLNGFSETTEFEIIKAGGFSPYFNEDFETGFDKRFWTIENPDDDMSWEILNVGGSGHGQYAAALNFYEYYSFTQRDRLISPSYNLEGMSNAVLEFDHAYAKRYAQISDSLIVLISEDCGNSWNRLLSLGENGDGNFATHIQSSNGFVPQIADDWCGSGYGSNCYSINLDQYVGKANIKIAFETYNANGNPLYIDNVKISQFVDISENQINTSDVTIFPNPTNGSFSIINNSNEKFDNYEIINHLGQIVIKSKINQANTSIEINTKSELKTGVYFIKLSGERKSISSKLIIL